MQPIRLSLAMAAASAVLALGAGAASAGSDGCSGACFVKVKRPALYGIVHRHVETWPAVAHVYKVPATYAVVRESVVVSPARVVWSRTHDRHGREVMCREVVPARYGTVEREVMVSPPHHDVIVTPARTVTEVRTVQIASPGVAWVPVRHHHHRRWVD